MVSKLGLPVTTDMPRLVYDLMELYPQGNGARPSVLYVPMRRDRNDREAAGPAPMPGEGK